MRRSEPKQPANGGGAWDTQAGQWLPEAAAEPTAAPAAAPAKPSGAKPPTKRQTLDLPNDSYRALQRRAGSLAETMDVSEKQINGQTILRELVERYLHDDELQKSVDRTLRDRVKG